MNSDPNLDDPNQTVFYIPFAGLRLSSDSYRNLIVTEGSEDEDLNAPTRRSIYEDRDISEGEKLRADAYKESWGKCLDRIQSIIHALHAPIAAEIVHNVLASYKNPLPGLPYPELPVVSIANSTSGSAFFDEITAHTDSSNIEIGGLFETVAFTTHIYPYDCMNLTAAMKSIIGGFVDRPHILEKAKKKPKTSLAQYDMEMLLTWYAAIRDLHDIKEDHQPTLVVIMHDFEQLNPIVVQDVVSILSLYVSKLPLVLILALSSPSTTSYLQNFYPRSTLALIRIHEYSIPSGPHVLEEILLKTFFSTEFQPTVMIGPAALTFLVDFYNRHNSSVDAVVTILQLIHMKHFSMEPFTLLVSSTPSPNILGEPTSLPLVESLFSRVRNVHQDASLSREDDSDWSQHSLTSLIRTVDDARTSFSQRVNSIRKGFAIVELAQNFMEEQRYSGLKGDKTTMLDVAIDILAGNSGPAVNLLGIMIRKLTPTQARSFAIKLKSLVGHLDIDDLPEPLCNGNDILTTPDYVEWLTGYLNDSFAPLEEATLWDIWYTGQTPFPADLINPSLRASVVAGLLRPHDFSDRETDEDLPLWELPDMSILFHGYSDSGRMINLYDWFESFQLELERQRKVLKQGAAKNRSKSSSPKKSGKRGRGRKEEVKQGDESDEEDLEQWKMEIQARFMRALQELDYLGFIKHTGRKADHVQRTVFDLHD